MVDHGLVVLARAQFVTLHFNSFVSFGKLNVYCCNFPRPQANFGHQLAALPLPKAEWILVADFNVIKSFGDLLGKYTNPPLTCREFVSWNRLLTWIRVMNPISGDQPTKPTLGILIIQALIFELLGLIDIM